MSVMALDAEIEAHRTLRPHDAAFTLLDLTDAGLRSLRRQYLHDAANADDLGQTDRAENARRRAEWVRVHQINRFALRMRYGARDDGTAVYDRHERLGQPPCYRLAALIDRTAASLGRRHILNWPAS